MENVVFFGDGGFEACTIVAGGAELEEQSKIAGVRRSADGGR